MTESILKDLKKCGAILSIVFYLTVLSISLAFAGDIVVYGDSQHNQEAHQLIVNEILKTQPSIVFRVGDMVNDGDSPEQWQTLRTISQKLFKTVEYFPALGNHEKESPLYFENFPYLHNQKWYSVERQGIHFIVLDSNAELQVGSAQYQWLESDLRGIKDETKFKIVIFHHPLFGVSMHQEDEKGLKPILMPLLEKYGVNAVFSGHDHNYARFEYKGIIFITTGGGGSNLVNQTRSSPYLKKFVKTWHYCVITPDENFLSVRVLDISSAVIDEFEISSLVLSGV